MKKYNDLLGTRFFLESCPHYFLFDSDILFAPDGYLYTMAPPLRSAQEKAILRRHFNEFRIDRDRSLFLHESRQKPR
ncbi:MAG: hypothetical protein MZU97_20645 [Bacillus subtilis]|nr:hypothetical protein [Bacillus subtilis]